MNGLLTPFSSPPTAPCRLITRRALTMRASSLRSPSLSFPPPLAHDMAGLSTPPAAKHENRPSPPPPRPTTTTPPFPPPPPLPSTPSSPPSPTINDVPSLSHAADLLLHSITSACDQTLQPFSPKTDGRGFPWWNPSCMMVVALTHDTRGRAHCLASRALRATIHIAKHEWYENVLTDPSTDLWRVATWRKGRCNNNIPPISLPS